MRRGSRKRRREPSPAAAAAGARRKLLPGEAVEVLSSDQGLCGSWHQAVVTDIFDNSRSVRYKEFVDDSGSPLIEEVAVSDAAIDGVPAGRGKVRPVRPHQPLQASDASYGLCVDALVEGSYWEGVIADHAEGAVERKVLFPDEGDERVMAVCQLRRTQDWDEATGEWKQRGLWAFLQMLLSLEEKDGCLPVSVRQIWYDFRAEAPSSDMWWTCSGTESFSWEKSLAQLIEELWSVCGGRPPLQEALTPADSQNKKKAEPDVLDDSTPADNICQTMSEFISCYRSNDRLAARAKREPIKRHLKSLGWKFVEDRPKNKYCVSPNGKRFMSVIGACEYYLAQNETRQDCCHTDHLLLHSATRNNNPVDMDLALREENKSSCNELTTVASTSWKPEQPNAEDCHTNQLLLHTVTPNNNPGGMELALREENLSSCNELTTVAATSWRAEQLDAELSPQIASLLASDQEVNTLCQVHIEETMRMKLKKHLLALGWSIEVRDDKARRKGKPIINKRYRYKSPAGETYFSILNVLKSFTVQCVNKQVQGNSTEDNHNCLAPHGVNLDAVVLRDLARVRKRKRGQKSDNARPGITTDDMPTCHGKSKKRKSSSVPMSQPRVLTSRHGQILPSPHRTKTVLSLLVEKNILLPRVRLIYKQTSDGPQIKEGSIVRDGIKCRCCNELFTLERFEAHAGCRTQLPAAHMFLKDGRSLSQCLVELMGENKPKSTLHVRLKKDYSDMESDSICSICNDGGDILLCDSCPSSFHHACVGLEATPEGSWYCPSCRCSICDSGDYDPDTNQFTEKTVMYCDQCEREYHVGCIRNKGDQLTSCPEGCWFCSRECSEIFQHLQELIGKPTPTPVEGVSCTILKFDREKTSDGVDFDNEKMAEQYGKLCIALDVLHECFVTIIEPRTRRDISEDIVFNRESELRRLNFRGFYTILLQKDGELISVGTFRICGKKFAELPLIGTRLEYRRQGMCRLIMNELEKILSGWGVERLVLPAIGQLLETWTGSFGFRAMSNSDRFELAESSVLSFQGTTMCQKILDAEQMELGNKRIVSFERSTTSDTVINNASNHSEELKVSSNALSHLEELNALIGKLECTSIVDEILESDSPESTSVVMEDTDQLEPESNSGEEDICGIDVLPTSSPNQEVGFTVDAHGQPYGRSAQRELCFD